MKQGWTLTAHFEFLAEDGWSDELLDHGAVTVHEDGG